MKKETANDTLNVRVRPSDKKAWKKQAKKMGVPMSQFIVSTLNNAINS